MISGSMDISCENPTQAKQDRIYRIRFLPFDASKHGAVASQASRNGEEPMITFLVGLQDSTMPLERRQFHARQWMLQLQNNGSLSLSHVSISDEQYCELVGR